MKWIRNTLFRQPVFGLAQRQGMSTQSSCNSKKGYFEPYPSFCNSLHVPHRFLSWRLCNGVSDVDCLGTTLLQHHHEVVPFNMQVSVKRWWWVSMKLCIWMKLWNLFWQEHHSSEIMYLDVFWSPDLETLWRRPQTSTFRRSLFRQEAWGEAWLCRNYKLDGN